MSRGGSGGPMTAAPSTEHDGGDEGVESTVIGGPGGPSSSGSGSGNGGSSGGGGGLYSDGGPMRFAAARGGGPMAGHGMGMGMSNILRSSPSLAASPDQGGGGMTDQSSGDNEIPPHSMLTQTPYQIYQGEIQEIFAWLENRFSTELYPELAAIEQSFATHRATLSEEAASLDSELAAQQQRQDSFREQMMMMLDLMAGGGGGGGGPPMRPHPQQQQQHVLHPR